MYLYAVLALAAIVGLAIFIPYRVTLDYQLLQGNDDFNVEIAWLGIPLLRRRLPLISSILESVHRAKAGARGEEGEMDDALQSHDTEQELVEGIEGLLWFGRRYRWIFDAIYSFAFSKSPEKMQMPHGQQLLLSAAASLYRFIHLEKLYWYSRVGLGDAAATAITVGVLSGIFATGFTWLDGKVQLDPEGIHWQVVPNYNQWQIDMVIHCILRVNAGHIIITGVTNLWRVGITKLVYWKNQLVH